MKSHRMLFGFVALLLVVSLACGGSAEPTANPTLPPVPTAEPVQQQEQQQQNQGSSSDLITFTDENNLLQFDLPGDWFYEQTSDTNYYVDSFTSPDGTSAIIESLVYNDGTAFVSSQKGKFALDLINTFYSATGQVGDIRVTSDQIMDDGSERLEWVSKSGGFSGVSFLETRGNDNATFLLFTAKWLDTADQSILDAIDNAIASYRIP